MEQITLLAVLITGNDEVIESYIEKYLGHYGVELYRDNRNKGIIEIAWIIWSEAKMNPQEFHG